MPPPSTLMPDGHCAVKLVTDSGPAVPSEFGTWVTDKLVVTVSPRSLTTRVVPAGPWGPVSPRGPRCPLRKLRAPKLRSRTPSDRSRTSDERTALDRIWLLPTLLRGSVIAAYDVPPRATKTAIVAMTFEYVKRSLNWCISLR